MSGGYSDQLIDFVINTRYEDIPEHIIEYTKLVYLDSIICAIAAGVQERSQMLAKVYTGMGGNPESTIFGCDIKVPAAHAAAANAEAMNLLDADDTFFSSAHFAAFTASACLAESERTPCSGRDLIKAMAVGFDINARIFLSQVTFGKTEDGRFQFSPVQGMGFSAFGTAVSAGLIRNMDWESMRRMLGVAGWLAPTPTCNPQADKVTHNSFKYANYAGVAQAGMMAVQYTEAGYSGQDDILDSGAFMRAQGCLDMDLELLIDELGSKWWIEDSCIKYYPSCRYTSAPIDMLLSLMKEKNLDPEDIESIDIEMTAMAYAMNMFNNPAREITADHRAPLNGSFNIPFAMASAALGLEPAGPAWYSEAQLKNQKVWDFAAKVTTSQNEGSYAEIEKALQTKIRRFKKNPSAMKVKAKGEAYQLNAEYANGDPWTEETMPNWDTMHSKFVNFCGGILSSKELDHITDSVKNLDSQDQVSALL